MDYKDLRDKLECIYVHNKWFPGRKVARLLVQYLYGVNDFCEINSTLSEHRTEIIKLKSNVNKLESLITFAGDVHSLRKEIAELKKELEDQKIKGSKKETKKKK